MNQERRNQIIRMVNENQVVKNNELMERFGISIETVRRDLKYLEKQGHLQCVYGGAVLKQPSARGPAPLPNASKNVEEKEAIARAAAGLVESGETIYLEEGSTVLAMTKYLREVVPVTVITNSLRIAMVLSEIPGCTVILPGGKVEPKSLELIGLQSEENLGMFNIDKAFIGACGITETHFTDAPIERGYIRRRVIKDSMQAIVLADHSKFGVRGAVNYASIDELDVVVTDDETPETYIRRLENAGIRVVVAKAKHVKNL